MTATMVVFATLLACVGHFGTNVAMLRESAWGSYLRTLPTGLRPLVLSNLFTGMVAVVVFRVMGLAVGYTMSLRATTIVDSIFVLALAVGGGMFFDPDNAPPSSRPSRRSCPPGEPPTSSSPRSPTTPPTRSHRPCSCPGPSR